MYIWFLLLIAHDPVSSLFLGIRPRPLKYRFSSSLRSTSLIAWQININERTVSKTALVVTLLIN